MKGIYLTEEGKKEIEAKIAELDKQKYRSIEFDLVFYGTSGKVLMLKEILSSATILPVEESWKSTEDICFPTLYPNGVVIKYLKFLYMKILKILWCDMFHWKNNKKIITFYSNGTHRYYCDKCNHEYDE
jgi:hypothetical protein